jgi:hypothetical protein
MNSINKNLLFQIFDLIISKNCEVILNGNRTRLLQNALLACLALIDTAMLCGGLGLTSQPAAWISGLRASVLTLLFMHYIYLGGNSVSHRFFFRYGMVFGLAILIFSTCLIIILTLRNP